MDKQLFFSTVAQILENIEMLQDQVAAGKESEEENLKAQILELKQEIKELRTIRKKLTVENEKLSSFRLLKVVSVVGDKHTHIWESYHPEVHVCHRKGFIGEIVPSQTPVKITTGDFLPQIGDVGHLDNGSKVRVIAHIDL